MAPAGKGDRGLDVDGEPVQPNTLPPPPPHRVPRVRTDPHQSEEELAKVGELLRLFDIARAHRRPMVAKWQECYRMLHNKFWDAGRPGYMPSPEITEIYPIVDAIAAWEMDQRPKFTFAPISLPHTPQHQFMVQTAEDMERVVDAGFQANLEEGQWAIANWDKLVYGTGLLKTTWDQTLAGGRGDAITRRVSPFAFYPDPNATSIHDGDYYIEVRRMSVQQLDRAFPGTANLFRTGGVDHDIDVAPDQISDDNGQRPARANPGAISPVTTPRYGQPGGARVHAVDLPGVTVIECWLRDHEVYDARTDLGGEKRVVDRWRVCVVAGNRLILDEPAENLWDHGDHPYSRMVQRDAGEFWGRSLVEMLGSSQKALNQLLAATQYNVLLAGNPIWRDTGNSRQSLTNKPGTRIDAGAAGKDAGWVPPPPFSPAFMELIRYHLGRMEAISGLTAIAKGGAPGGRPSESVVDALQEAGFVRIRSSLRELEYTMRTAGEKKVSLIAENYTTPRMIAIAGPRGERTSMVLRARHFMVPTSTGHIPMKYQIIVDAGSRHHTSRSMREDRAAQLFTLGAIDRTALLEDIDYPNATTVAARMDQREMELAAAGEQAGPGKRERARA